MVYPSTKRGLDMLRLKGARREVLRTIHERSINGICTISIDDLADITDYCPATISLSIKYLIENKVIGVTKVAGDRRNSYVLGGID
jgi:hypothetical protein